LSHTIIVYFYLKFSRDDYFPRQQKYCLGK
jgi:hypothetical protein